LNEFGFIREGFTANQIVKRNHYKTLTDDQLFSFKKWGNRIITTLSHFKSRLPKSLMNILQPQYQHQQMPQSKSLHMLHSLTYLQFQILAGWYKVMMCANLILSCIDLQNKMLYCYLILSYLILIDITPYRALPFHLCRVI
jgi:hypothetical protein